MITVNELREVLRSIGFVEKNDVFSIRIHQVQALM